MVFETAIRPEIDHFSAIVFEQACRQYFWRVGLRGQLPFMPRQIGGWWQANQEVDLVLLGEERMMLVECKWSSRPVGADILQALEAKSVDVCRDAGLQNVDFGLCSRSGFTEQLIELSKERKNVFLFSWNQML
jgi:hypothetical protein